jgi:hypothetical protein
MTKSMGKPAFHVRHPPIREVEPQAVRDEGLGLPEQCG